uniref:non-specific serine/threonine protein kinase n=1 Tax=Panagrellus redivivus TaxID=6233 RepID=A0A7E4UMU1_PANRE
MSIGQAGDGDGQLFVQVPAAMRGRIELVHPPADNLSLSSAWPPTPKRRSSQKHSRTMATSSGGENHRVRTATFHVPPQDDEDLPFESMDRAPGRRFLSMSAGDHNRDAVFQQLTLDTLNQAFNNDLQIFQGIDEDVQEIWADKPPKIISGYLFGRELGNGSYGKVKEVFHCDRQTKHAIKIIKDKRVCKIPNGIANVQREFGVLQGLSHPNVIRLIDSFRLEDRGKLYLVFELCVTSIQDILDSIGDSAPEAASRFTEPQARFYFAQLVAGLGYLHGRGIIHKDIKPQNLLVTADNVLKIADFGVAEQFQDPGNDWCTQSQGTPALQAPEVVAGEVDQFRGKPTDIWAAGVSLYRMVVGTYPFDGSVLMKLFDSIIKDDPVIPPELHLSAEFYDLLNGMLVKNPEVRFSIAQVEASAWVNGPTSPDDFVPLPATDVDEFFTEKLAEVTDHPDDVVYVDTSVAFTGTYPPNVVDRTFQTPCSARNNFDERDRLVDLTAEPFEGEKLDFDALADGHPAEINANTVPSLQPTPQPSATPSVTSSSAATAPRKKSRLKSGFLNCFRNQNASPE